MRAAILCPGPSLATAALSAREYDLRIGVNRAPVIRADVPVDWWCFGDGRVFCRETLPYKPRLFLTFHAHREAHEQRDDWVKQHQCDEWEHRMGEFPPHWGWSNYSAAAALILAAWRGATDIDVYGSDWRVAPDADGVQWTDNDRSEHRWGIEQTVWACVVRELGERGVKVRRLRCPKYISYYTTGTGYAEEAAALAGTFGRFGMANEVVGLPSRGDWTANCAEKARFICGILETAKTPIVWLDADARVKRYPGLFDELHERCDFAAHWLGDELLSGTLYFNDTPAALKLARDWAAACDSQSGQWDQKLLQSVWSENIRTERLPPEYCWIEGAGTIRDISEYHYGKREPVILQTQASRKLRRSA